MPAPKNLAKVQLNYVNSIDKAMEMKRWLSEDRNRSCIGIDTETTGLSWNRPGDDLRLVQIGDTQTGWAIPWHLWGGVFMECLDLWPGNIALHNLQFDLKFLTRYGKWQVPWHRMHDTMIMARILRPGKSARLKPLSKELVDSRAAVLQGKLDKKMDENGWDWATVPLDLPEYHLYGALDPVETAWLFDVFRADQKYPKVYDLEMAYLRCAYEMEVNGFRVDLEYAEKKHEELLQQVERSRAWGEENLGVSIGSTLQVIDFFRKRDRELEERHRAHGEGECDALCGGVKITEKTDSGSDSVNADQLKIFLKHPDKQVRGMAKLTYEARKAEKLAGTYFKAIMERNVDGRLHASINTMGAITARNSVSQPNMQNLPSNSSLVKNAFLPEEGHLLLSSDLDQVELRIATNYSKDPGLIQLFKEVTEEGGDIFTTLGRDLYSDPGMEKKDPRRALVKVFAYASMYGASVEKQAEGAGVSVETMQDFADMFAEKYPGLSMFQNGTILDVKRRLQEEGEGYVITPTTGRRIPVERRKEYRGSNYLIQSSAADVMKQNVVELAAAGLGDRLRMPVHDEIIVDCPKEDLREVQEIVTECMTTTEGWEAPLTADCSEGLSRWGDKY